jgi:hypothetical protein
MDYFLIYISEWDEQTKDNLLSLHTQFLQKRNNDKLTSTALCMLCNDVRKHYSFWVYWVVEVFCFHSDAVEVFILLGCGTASKQNAEPIILDSI